MTRIHWTETERNDVIKHAVAVFVKNNCDYTHLEALRLGQNLALPVHRRRTLSTHSAAKHEISLLKAAYNAYIATLQKSKEVVAPVVEVSKPPEPPAGPQLTTATVEELVGEIARRIAVNLTATIAHEIKVLEHQFSTKRHDPSYKSDHIFKKRIVIIGLLNDQEQAIAREFEDKFKLKFLGNEAARSADISTADAYLLMKSFISHAVYGKYQKLPNHVLIDGGMSTLRMWLNTKGAEL